MKYQNAFEFGKPKVLSATAEGFFDPKELWDAIWRVKCECSSSEIELLDSDANMDCLSEDGVGRCNQCGRLMWLLAINSEEDDVEVPSVQELHTVGCSHCESPIWSILVRFSYPENLEEDAEDIPEYLEEGLANQWGYLEVIGSCKCGNIARLFDREAW